MIRCTARRTFPWMYGEITKTISDKSPDKESRAESVESKDTREVLVTGRITANESESGAVRLPDGMRLDAIPLRIGERSEEECRSSEMV